MEEVKELSEEAVTAANVASTSNERLEPSAPSSTHAGGAMQSTSMQNGQTSTQIDTLQRSKFIQAGDLVIIYLSRDRNPVPLTVTPGQELTNTYGSFVHNDMIGLPFGAKLASRNRRGFIHLLRPNPELWTLALPHRTQILYTHDMSFIASHLGLSPGARLIEAGTGSGSFSHYTTRCVARRHPQANGTGWKGAPSVRSSHREGRRSNAAKRAEDPSDVDPEVANTATRIPHHEDSEEEQERKEPADAHEAEVLSQLAAEPDVDIGPREGRVWSFEFHASRALKAWEEFNHHGLFPTISLRHRNVVKNGFGLESMADAVFLDLPAPWDAIPHAARAMRRDVATRICCFSPCVEQVLRTLQALRKGQQADEGEEVRWTDIETYECLNRTHLSIWCGSNTPAPIVSIDDAIKRIQSAEERKGKRRAVQIQRARKERLLKLNNDEADGANTSETPVSTDVDAGMNDGEAMDNAQRTNLAKNLAPGQKRKRGSSGDDQDDDSNDEGIDDEQDKEMNETDAPMEEESGQEKDEMLAATMKREGKILKRANVVSRPFNEMRGHTSYLTFATLVPRLVQRQPDPTLEREREALRRKEAAAERLRLRKEQGVAETQKSTDHTHS